MATVTGQNRSAWVLFGITVLAAGFWLAVLPRWSRWPPNQRYLDRLDAAGIDASAMVYTELPPEMFLDAKP